MDAKPTDPRPSGKENTPPQLQRRFGLLQATALNMSNMIGVGPFITIPALLSALGGPQSMLGWLLALLVTVPDSLIWAELGAAMPGSGGTYRYLREAFHPERLGRLMAFLFIWQFILSGPLEIASGYIGFSQYLRYLWPGMTRTDLWIVGGCVGALNILLLYRKITAIGKIMVGLWIGSMLTVAMVLITGVLHFDPAKAFDFPPFQFSFSFGFLMGLGSAARIGIYDYLGYYDVCYIGDEVRDPGRVIPKSVVLSLLLVAAIYIGINLSVIGIVPWREFVPVGDPPAPIVSLMMQRVWGPTVASIFTWLILWTTFASVFALLLGYSRIPYAAAMNGDFFAVFKRLHAGRNIPHISLLTLGIIAIVCTFLPLMTVIDGLLITRILVQFIGQIFAVIVLRQRAPNLARPYRIWLYPLPAFLALAGWLFVFGTSPRVFQLYGVGVLGAGVVIYLARAYVKKLWPFVNS